MPSGAGVVRTRTTRGRFDELEVGVVVVSGSDLSAAAAAAAAAASRMRVTAWKILDMLHVLLK